MDRSSLESLQPLYVSVYVEGNAGLTNLPGMDPATFHTVVDSVLASAKVAMARGEPGHVLEREPVLSVHINAMRGPDGLIPFAVEIDLIQGVVVANVPNTLIHAATWDSGTVGLVSENRVAMIKQAVIGIVREFVDDYRVVNPL